MRWEDHIDTVELDHALSDVFRDAPDCGAFGAFDDLSRRRMLNDILIQAAKKQPAARVDTSAPPRTVRILLLGAAAAVLLLGLAGAVSLGVLTSSQKAEPSSHPTYFGEVQRLDGSLYFDETRAVLNAPVPVDKTIRTGEGAAQLRLPTGIFWELGSRSKGEIEPLSTDHLGVSVLSGESWFRVDPMRRGPAFSVNTKMGRIDVRGTIFVVNAAHSDVRVTLLKGKVWITTTAGHREFVTAGHVMQLGQKSQHVLSSSERRRMMNRLTELTWTNEKTTIAANTPVEATEEIDADPNSDTPLSVSTRDPMITPATPAQLLQEIQRHRKGRNWGKVAGLYKRLIQSAPGSETAIVSRVSLGEIYLSKLQKYKEALFHFDKYLQSGHTALLPEASFGRCNALKALGNRMREIQCLDGFLKRFSGAFQAPKARARLEVLRSPDRI